MTFWYMIYSELFVSFLYHNRGLIHPQKCPTSSKSFPILNQEKTEVLLPHFHTKLIENKIERHIYVKMNVPV